MDPKLGEALFRLLADALKGVAAAQDALKSLAEMPRRPEAFHDWIRTNAPNLGDLVQSELFGQDYDEWLRMVGFVPRYRYLELLERYEVLRLRFEELEATREEIQSKLDPATVASDLLAAMGKTMERTIAAQAQWMDLFRGAGDESAGEKDEEPTTPAP